MTKRSQKLQFYALIGMLLFLGNAIIHAQQAPADPSANSDPKKATSKANDHSAAATLNPPLQTPPSPTSKPSAQTPTPPANGAGIAWVNTASGLYPGSRFYGKTKRAST